ncbi:MAG: glycosyltransferase family 2 protein [Spirochaetaceae bacterium]|nr:glycosyltransferase family 2 protein [Spirochaetaceae bacterium]
MSINAFFSVFSAVCLAASAYVLLLTLCNNGWLFYTARQKCATKGPRVSVLVPARNEEERIRPCLESLLRQDYDNYSILVYDDDSTDATGQILDEYAARNPGRLRVIHGRGLPEGWYGKPNAMQCLSAQSDGEYLLFTDADTVHGPDSIGRLVAAARRYDADLVSGYVRHTVGSFGETAIVPSLYILTMIVMPLWMIHRTKSPAISHAIGQLMFFRASKYREIGGYSCVRLQVSEDVQIARQMKVRGGKVVFIDAKGSVTCRMYVGYKSAMKGISKNIFDYFGKNTLLLTLATIAAALFLFAPLVGMVIPAAVMIPAQRLFLASYLAMLLAWSAVAVQRSFPWYLPFIFPLVFINVLSGAWYACRLFRTGNSIEWKGRMVK